MFRFFSAMKLAAKRALAVHLTGALTQRFNNTLFLFPLVSL